MKKLVTILGLAFVGMIGRQAVQVAQAGELLLANRGAMLTFTAPALPAHEPMSSRKP